MFSNYLSTIDGVSIFPIISLLLFFGIFVGIIIWVIKLNKNYISKMENLPLENELELIKTSESKNEK